MEIDGQPGQASESPENKQGGEQPGPARGIMHSWLRARASEQPATFQWLDQCTRVYWPTSGHVNAARKISQRRCIDVLSCLGGS